MNVFDTDRQALLNELEVAGVLVGWRSQSVDSDLVTEHDLRVALLRYQAEQGGEHFGGGILDIPEGAGGQGYLYDPRTPLPGDSDVYVSPKQIEALGLRRGDVIYGRVRPPQAGERFWSIYPVEMVTGCAPQSSEIRNRRWFESLTAVFPHRPFDMGTTPGTRLLRLIAPLCYGQRALLVAPPEAGKTTLLQEIAKDLVGQVGVVVILIDERPEEVTDFERAVPEAEVLAATFDEEARDQVRLFRTIIEMVKRRVELGADCFLLWDGITRFTYQLADVLSESGKESGRTLPGGVVSGSITGKKSARGGLSAGRELEGGGSLGILATCLVETGDRGDELVYQRFKGTGNATVRMSRGAADRRVYTAFDIAKCKTRRCEDFMSPEEMAWQEVVFKALGEECPVRWPSRNGDSVERLQILYNLMGKHPRGWEPVVRGLLGEVERAYQQGFGKFVKALSIDTCKILRKYRIT